MAAVEETVEMQEDITLHQASQEERNLDVRPQKYGYYLYFKIQPDFSDLLTCDVS